MSYDLYFIPTGPAPDLTALATHFARRPHYKVDHGQALYENPATGTHFIWDIGAAEGEDDPEDPAAGAHAVLVVNFARPTSFGHEAAREIAAFLDAFPFRAHDPQEGADIPEPFDPDAFAATYTRHAAWGAKAISAQSDHRFPLAPRDDILRVWRWNYDSERLQTEFGEDIFVPKMWHLDRAGTVGIAVIWADGMATLVPDVDYVACVRDQTAPRSGFFRRKTSVIELLTHAQFLAEFGDIFRPDARVPGAVSFGLDSQAKATARLAARPAGLHVTLPPPPAGAAFSVIPAGQALDRELFAPEG